MIVGQKIELRGIEKKDAPLIYDWVNQAELRELTGTVYPVSEYEHEKWIASVTCSDNRKIFAIYRDDRCVGTIGLKNIDYINSNAELFVSIGDQSSRNLGGGTDAVSTLVSYCFLHLNLHRIYLHVFESNVKAIHCYEKAGFSVEGKLLDHHFAKGKYENVLVMGKVYSP